jgi:hypothetical protein
MLHEWGIRDAPNWPGKLEYWARDPRKILINLGRRDTEDFKGKRN